MRPRFQPLYKPRKCHNRRCRKEFTPFNFWQKYCSVRCRSAVANRKNMKLIQKGKLAELVELAEQQQRQQEEQGAV